MGNLYIKPGSLIKSAGDPNNGYIAEAKNIKYDNSYSIQDKIDELYELINNLSPTPPPTQSYTIMLFVTNGTMSPNDSQTVISGGSAVWTIYPNAGFQLPTSVNGATINGNRLTVSNVTSDQTIEVICEPIPVTQTYYWYAGTTQITSENYEQLASQVTSYNSEYSVTSESRLYIYILVATNKTVTLIEPTLNAPIDLIEMTDINIPDHKVYRTAGKCMGENIPIRIS